MRNGVVSCLAMCGLLSNVFVLAMDRNQGPVCVDRSVVSQRFDVPFISLRSTLTAAVLNRYFPLLATSLADHRITSPTGKTPAGRYAFSPKDHPTSPPKGKTPADHSTTSPKGKTPAGRHVFSSTDHPTSPPKDKTPRDEDLSLSASSSLGNNDSLVGPQESWVYEPTSPCKAGGMKKQRLSMEELSVLSSANHYLRQSFDVAVDGKLVEHATNGSPRQPTPKGTGK